MLWGLALCGLSMSAPALAMRPRSELGLQQVVQADDEPRLLLAQRVIEREWSTPEELRASNPMPPGYQSELRAFTLSAMVPGAGQLAMGERSGYVFALAEIASVLGLWWYNNQAETLREDAAKVAGEPDELASSWSFERWETATEQEADEIERLYQVDREAFYHAIGSDARYSAGWSDPNALQHFRDLRAQSDARLEGAQRAEIAVWLNHVVAALDAVRAARIRNLPLVRGVELKASGEFQSGRPRVTVALRRSFR